MKRTPRARSDKEPPSPRHIFPIEALSQPGDVSCGPTCPHGVQRYFGQDRSFGEIVARTGRNPDGGLLNSILFGDATGDATLPEMWRPVHGRAVR